MTVFPINSLILELVPLSVKWEIAFIPVERYDRPTGVFYRSMRLEKPVEEHK